VKKKSAPLCEQLNCKCCSLLLQQHSQSIATTTTTTSEQINVCCANKSFLNFSPPEISTTLIAFHHFSLASFLSLPQPRCHSKAEVGKRKRTQKNVAH